MRHNKESRRFSRPSGHLKSMMANLTNSLLEHGRLKTTTPKAKELRRYAERMITLGKSGTLPSRRRAMAYLRNKKIVTKLFTELGPDYKDRNGGYTRIYKLGPRPGDCAPMSLIELVEGQSAMAEAAEAAEAAASAKKPARKKAEKKASLKKTSKKIVAKEVIEKPEEKTEKKGALKSKQATEKPEKKAEKKTAKKATEKETKKED